MFGDETYKTDIDTDDVFSSGQIRLTKASMRSMNILAFAQGVAIDVERMRW